MKLKRFLTFIALLILTMIMLTGCMEVNTTANVAMKFDSQTITLNSDKKGYVYLEIDVKDGENEDTFQKRLSVSKGKTITISIENIAKDFFSENAQICNVTVVKTTKRSFVYHLLFGILNLFVLVIIVIVILANVFME